MFRVGSFWRSELYHLHFIKLMDALQTSCVFTVSTRFTPKTRRIGGIVNRQIFGGEDLTREKDSSQELQPLESETDRYRDCLRLCHSGTYLPRI